MLPPYYLYDENDDTKLSLRLFDGYENIIFEKANEYTIVVAKILLRLTDKEVWIS